MNIILFGPPGSGKGTQSDNLVEKFNLFKVSTGDLLRKEIEKKTALGNKIKSIIDKGMLVSDELINDLLEKVLTDKKNFDKLIFDGYPRNLNQAKQLDALLKKNKQKLDCVFILDVRKEIVIKRVLGRLVCSKCGLTFNKFFNLPNKDEHKCEPQYLKQRSDDNEETILKRMQTYSKQTLPILNYYKNQKLLYEIDGMNEIHQIFKEISKIMYSLEA